MNYWACNINQDSQTMIMLVLTTIKLQKHSRQNKKALPTVSVMFCYFTVRESRGERNQFIHQWFWKLPSSGQLKERKGIETSSRNPKEHPLTRASCSSMAMVCSCTASSGGRPLNTFTKPFTKLPNLSTLAFKCRLIWRRPQNTLIRKFTKLLNFIMLSMVETT